jgi:hypothetical protein
MESSQIKGGAWWDSLWGHQPAGRSMSKGSEQGHCSCGYAGYAIGAYALFTQLGAEEVVRQLDAGDAVIKRTHKHKPCTCFCQKPR